LQKLLESLAARDKKERVEEFDFDEALKRPTRPTWRDLALARPPHHVRRLYGRRRRGDSSRANGHCWRPTLPTWWTTRQTTTRPPKPIRAERTRTSTRTTTATPKRRWSSSVSSSRSLRPTSSRTHRSTSGTPTSGGCWSSRLARSRLVHAPDCPLGEGARRTHSLPLPLTERALSLRLGRGPAAETQGAVEREQRPAAGPEARADGHPPGAETCRGVHAPD
jgi:hypothetical protein